MGDTRKRTVNRGLRKVCACSRRSWAKCPHSWHFNFKVRGGPAYRFSVDTEAGKHIAGKTEAETLADGWRTKIRAGTFRRRVDAPPETPATDAPLTLAGFITRYTERVAKPLTGADQRWLRALQAFQQLGEKPLLAVTTDDVEAFIADLRARGRAASTRNKAVQAVRALFRWATRKGYLERDVLAAADHVKREKHAKRSRRLRPGEEAALLAAAPPHLQRLIIAAVETGCRRGELFNLQWSDVNLARKEITIRAEHTKTSTTRHLPVSVRLAAVLEMAKTDPAGKTYGPADYVFGEVGRKVSTIKRAWQTAVVKASGHVPTWTAQNALDAASQAVFKAADLHFHDLRHEAGSRLLEAGWPLHHVQHMLGHANIAQTSTYLNAERIGLRESMERLDASRCNPVANEGTIDPLPVRNDQTTDVGKALVN